MAGDAGAGRVVAVIRFAWVLIREIVCYPLSTSRLWIDKDGTVRVERSR